MAAAPRPPVLEWIAAAFGLAAILAMAGVLGLHALRGDDAPAALAVRQTGSERDATALRIAVEVANTGARTAAAVQIEGRAGADTASATIDYVPAHGRREAVLVFAPAADPAGVRVRAVGWVEP